LESTPPERRGAGGAAARAGGAAVHRGPIEPRPCRGAAAPGPPRRRAGGRGHLALPWLGARATARRARGRVCPAMVGGQCHLAQLRPAIAASPPP